MIKVAHVATRLNVGGITPHVVDLVANLPDEFASVLIAGVLEDDEQDMAYLAHAQDITVLTVPTLRRRIRPLDDLRALISLVRLFRRLRPDVVSSYMFKARLLGSVAARLARVPVVVETFNGTLFDTYFRPTLQRLLLWGERFVARRMVHRVIATTSSDREILLSQGVGSRDRIDIVTYGFDLERLADQAKEQTGAFRAELGAGPDDVVVGVVGRLVPVKGHRYLFEAIAAIAEDAAGANARFVVVGDGELAAELRDQVRQLGIDELVHFAGSRRDMAAVYAGLDVLAVPSLNEGTCIVVAEAMATDTAVVASAVGGIPDLVEDGETGLMVPPADPAELAAALRTILGDAGMRARFAASGATRVRSRFSLEQMVTGTADVYRQALERRR